MLIGGLKNHGMLWMLLVFDILAVASPLLPLSLLLLLFSSSLLSVIAAYQLVYCLLGVGIVVLVLINVLSLLILLFVVPNRQACHSPRLTGRYFLCIPFLLH